MTVISVVSSGPQGASSWATVGATGNYKPSSYGDDVSLAIAACLDANGQCDIQPGSYTASTALSRSAANEMIRGSQGAIITVSNSASVGFLTHSGTRFQMNGLRIVQSANVNDQIAVHITGNEPTFRDTIFEVSTASGSSSNPMTSLKLGTRTQGILAPMVNGCRFLPNKGSIGLHIAGDPDSGSTVGNGAKIWAHFGTETGTPRKCYKGIWFDSAGEADVDVRMHGLGDGTDPIYAAIHATTDSGESEAHHLYMRVNLELITGSHAIRLDGGRFTTITGIIGRCNGNGSSEGTIHVTDNTGSGPTAAGKITIGNMDIHNASTSSGRVIWLEDCDGVAIRNVTMALLNGRAIRVSASALGVTLDGIKFSGQTSGSVVETVGGDYTRFIARNLEIPAGCTLFTSAPNTGAGKTASITGFLDNSGATSIDKASGTTMANLSSHAIW